ncbi:MAG: hypothetical protein IPH84_13715 [Bacteroidales bacterium]|nr:hypothetical protein [Bacteroidales bacterium]
MIKYAVGIENGAICRSFDEGLGWNNISSITYGDLNSVFFTDDSTGFALGYVYGCDPFYHSNPILKTINGGNDWTVIFNSPFCLKSIHFPCDSIDILLVTMKKKYMGRE